MNSYKIGRWELGCIVFNSLIHKIFTMYPKIFFDISSSAGWLTSAFAGVVFLLILVFTLKLYSPFCATGPIDALRAHNKNLLAKIVSYIAIIYFAFSFIYTLASVCNALKVASFVSSPMWFTALFILLAAIVCMLCGKGAIYRVHSLSVLSIGTAAVSIALLSLKYADIYNLFPILGSGAQNVFARGLKTLFLYMDILIIFFLPTGKINYSFSKTVFVSALLAVLINITIVLSICLNAPFELTQNIDLPIYPLTKASSFGKVPLRLDTLYHIAMITSAILYISLALSVILRLIKKLSYKPKRVVASVLCILLCFSLCGCYDHSEVEENAYVIALGIDQGESARFKYTFQISNPLELGNNIGGHKMTDETKSAEVKNNTVDNIIVEANDYPMATDMLKSILSKEARLSHLKLIVFSFDVACKGMLDHSALLLHEREVRPGSNLCLAASAADYLTSVKPTLEESTVRYYELFFRNRSVPYAPVTELRDFVGRSLDSGYDATAPVVGSDGLSGMGIFSDGALKSILTPREVVIYKMLCGDLSGASVETGDKSYFISSRKKSKIYADFSSSAPTIHVTAYIDENSSAAATPQLINTLTSDAIALLNKLAAYNCDILGFGRLKKRECLTQNDWEQTNFDILYEKCNFNVRILP